jgi:hypothetical protein
MPLILAKALAVLATLVSMNWFQVVRAGPIFLPIIVAATVETGCTLA